MTGHPLHQREGGPAEQHARRDGRLRDLASATVGGTEERAFFDYFIDASDLVAGENILSVEVHQSARRAAIWVRPGAHVVSSSEDPATFFRGDADGNETRELTDAVVVLEFLFQSGAARAASPRPTRTTMMSSTSRIPSSSSSASSGNRDARPPYPDCGVDPTAGALAARPRLPAEIAACRDSVEARHFGGSLTS